MRTKKRYYWLGKDKPSPQDSFFLEALDSELWEQGDKYNWDTCWQTNMPEQNTFEQLSSHKTINHIPGNNALTIKSDLYTTLANAKKRQGDSISAKRYQFFPETFSMPEDYIKFQQAAADNPTWKWLQKPKNSSRGRGIKMLEHPSCAPLGQEWMIQRYLSKPHLYKGHKYVLRCYGLITSLEPLRCYWYKEGSMKLASDLYQYDNFDNPYSYLTNPDINEENIDADTELPVIFIPFANYRQWLQDEGIDDKEIFQKIEELIGLTIIAARETMREQSNVIHADTSGCYELIGFDCMIDDALNPWILECNLSPSLDICTEDGGGGQAETKTKRTLVKDIVSIMQLNEKDITSHQALLSPRDQALAEQKRAGNFQCIFPTHSASHYLHCFPIPRYADSVSLPTDIDIEDQLFESTPISHASITFDDSLALLTNNTHKDSPELIAPNEIATWIWIKNAEGNTPQTIINELIELLPNTSTLSKEAYHFNIANQVWGVLSDWSYNGLFTKNKPISDKAQAPQQTQYINLANKILKLRFAGNELEYYFSPFVKQIDINKNNHAKPHPITILASSNGYLITDNRKIIAENCALAEIIPTLINFVTTNLLTENQSIPIIAPVLHIKGKYIMVISDNYLLDSFAFFAHKVTPATLVANRAILNINTKDKTTLISPTELPLHLPLSDCFDCYSMTEKSSWTIAKNAQAPYWLSNYQRPQEPRSLRHIPINNIVFITTHSAPDDKNTYQLNTISQAQGLCYLSKVSRFAAGESTNTGVHSLAKWVSGCSIKQLVIREEKCPLLDAEHIEEIFKTL